PHCPRAPSSPLPYTTLFRSVAGAAGMELKETEPLASTPSEDEAIEIITAFIQLYRENAKYLDRAYKWVAKVGLDWVKERVVQDPDRKSTRLNSSHVKNSYAV